MFSSGVRLTAINDPLDNWHRTVRHGAVRHSEAITLNTCITLADLPDVADGPGQPHPPQNGP